VRYDLPEITPKTSLIILADEDIETARQAIKNYIENTDYLDYEIVLVGSEKFKSVLENQFFEPKTKFVACENRSEAARYNFGAAQASGEILCFVDPNLRPCSKDWLKELVSFAAHKEIGAVGAKILSADEMVLHGGLIIGTSETVSVANYKLPRQADGHLFRARFVNNYSAVSISCLAVRSDIFLENKGFDAGKFPDKFFDADLCLRLREKKHRIVFTPYAELTQINANKLLNEQKKASEKETEIFKRKWRNIIGEDPFYNPNFSDKNGSFSIKI
jgi:glycosyltransferase involved in cell wall biosynthesis